MTATRSTCGFRSPEKPQVAATTADVGITRPVSPGGRDADPPRSSVVSYPQQPTWQQDPAEAPSGLPVGGALPPPVIAAPNPYHDEQPPSGLPVGGVVAQPLTAPNPWHQPEPAAVGAFAPQSGNGFAPAQPNPAAYPGGAYAPQTQYAAQAGYAAQPNSAAQPHSAAQLGYAAQPGYEAQPGHSVQEQYVPQSGYAAQPGHAPQSSSAAQYAAQSGYPQQAQYAAHPHSPQAQYMPQPTAAPGSYQEAPTGQPAMYPGAPAFDQHARWTPPEPKASRPWSAAVVALAGLVAAAGSCLTWVTASAPTRGSMSVIGIADDAGRFTAMLGLMIAFLGIARYLGQTTRPANVSWGASTTSLILLVVGAYEVLDIRSAEEETRRFITDAEPAQSALAATFQMTVGPGLWMVIGAAVTGLIFGLLSLRRR
jgi:hypothetical protein